MNLEVRYTDGDAIVIGVWPAEDAGPVMATILTSGREILSVELA